MLDMFGDVIEEYHPTSGHFSFNPLIVDQSDDFFYEGVEMKLMFEDGLQVGVIMSRCITFCRHHLSQSINFYFCRLNTTIKDSRVSTSTSTPKTGHRE